MLRTSIRRLAGWCWSWYKLACYSAQLGHLNAARARLAEAIKVDLICHEMALIDPDLIALYSELYDNPSTPTKKEAVSSRPFIYPADGPEQHAAG